MATEVQRRDVYTAPQHFSIKEDAGARVHSSAFFVIGAIARHLRLVCLLPIALGVMFVLPSYVFGRNYVARSSFLPELGNANTQRLAGLAAQLGISVGNMGGGETLDSYVEIAQSRTVLGEAAKRRYLLPKVGLFGQEREGTLLDFYHVSAPTEGQRLQLAVKALGSAVEVKALTKSGLVTLATTAPSRELAEAINRNILDAINAFNLNKRQTRASNERKFVAERLQAARAEVDTAEGALRNFLASNRQYQGSPQLTLEYSRLQRRLDLFQQVYASLAQAHEQARIEEVRNTPVITLVDRPEGSASVKRSRRQTAILGFALGGLLAVMIATLLEWYAKLRERSPEEIEHLRTELGPLGRFLRDPPVRRREAR